ncbi:hypothetical protein KAR91_24070 [Candidatus Pacearchaeota archaeon]|nr:hypothetical protein [Candidatus Pacearchaeota archaeon]
MVSAGWNRNDDVFAATELWLAKCTPTHKPLNKEHKARSIVGHITRSDIVDSELNILENENETNCHILAEGVIYKHLGNADVELSEETTVFIQELRDKEWFVSMETLFSRFDYAIVHPSLGEAIVERNESTAFLTQYLRHYGGTGSYNGMKVGRLLRGLTFSAEGFVKNPANPNSVVLSGNKEFAASAAGAAILDNLKIIDEGEIMSETELQKKFDDSKAEIAKLREELAKSDIDAYQDQINKQESAINSLKTEAEENTKRIADLKTGLETANTKLSESVDSGLELKKCLDEANEQLKTVAAEKVSTDRVAKMVDVGIDKVEAEATVEKFNGVNDDQFNAIVELSKSSEKEPDLKVDDDEDVTVDADGEGAINDTKVEDAVVADELNLATAGDKKSSVVDDLSAFFKSKLSK